MGKTEIREVRTEVLDGHGGGDPAGTPGCTSQLCSSVTELFKIGPPPPPQSRGLSGPICEMEPFEWDDFDSPPRSLECCLPVFMESHRRMVRPELPHSLCISLPLTCLQMPSLPWGTP